MWIKLFWLSTIDYSDSELKKKNSNLMNRILEQIKENIIQ